jgi:thiol:disulfide interchange protein DsbD
LTDYGYEGETILLSKLTVPENAAANTPEIAADVRYLVCREVCIPGKDRVSASLSAAQDATLIQAARDRLPESLPSGTRIRGVMGTNSIVLSVSGRNSKLGEVADFIPAQDQVIDNSAKPEITKSAANTQLRLKKSEQLDHPVTELRGLLLTKDKAYNVVVPISAAKKSSRSSAPKQS